MDPSILPLVGPKAEPQASSQYHHKKSTRSCGVLSLFQTKTRNRHGPGEGHAPSQACFQNGPRISQTAPTRSKSVLRRNPETTAVWEPQGQPSPGLALRLWALFLDPPEPHMAVSKKQGLLFGVLTIRIILSLGFILTPCLC